MYKLCRELNGVMRRGRGRRRVGKWKRTWKKMKEEKGLGVVDGVESGE